MTLIVSPLDGYWMDIELFSRCVVWGQTCDEVDVVVPATQGCQLPMLDIGDWLYFEEMGAYTNAIGTDFNGFPKSARHHIFSASFQRL